MFGAHGPFICSMDVSKRFYTSCLITQLLSGARGTCGCGAAMPTARVREQAHAVATPHRQTKARQGSEGLHHRGLPRSRVCFQTGGCGAGCTRGAAQQESNSDATWESWSAGWPVEWEPVKRSTFFSVFWCFHVMWKQQKAK